MFWLEGRLRVDMDNNNAKPPVRASGAKSPVRASGAKAWRCGAGHVMGLVMRDGRGTPRLLLYRVAIPNPLTPFPEGKGEEVDVMAVIEGYVADVRCSICGRMRTWVPGEAELRQLLERVRMMNSG